MDVNGSARRSGTFSITEPSLNDLFSLETEFFVERLALRCSVQFDAFNLEISGAFQSAFHQTLRKPSASVFRPGQHHSDPRQAISVAQQSCGRGDQTVVPRLRNSPTDPAATSFPNPPGFDSIRPVAIIPSRRSDLRYAADEDFRDSSNAFLSTAKSVSKLPAQPLGCHLLSHPNEQKFSIRVRNMLIKVSGKYLLADAFVYLPSTPR